jgi:hypothetical protein
MVQNERSQGGETSVALSGGISKFGRTINENTIGDSLQLTTSIQDGEM